MEPPGAAAPAAALQEILPKNGLVYSEKGSLGESMCKPKIMPIKSALAQQLEEKQAEEQQLDERQQR